MGMLLLSGPQLPEVELKFFAFQNVTVGTTGLAWATGDRSVETSSGELGLEERVDLGLLFPLLQFAHNMVRVLHRLSSFGGGGGLSLFGYGDGIMRLIPLTERCSINLNNSTLDKGVCSHKFVIRCVVNNRDNSCLAGGMLRSPCEVAALETESAVFQVSTTDADGVHPLGAELGAGWLTAELELSFLAIMGALSPGLRAFVA